MQYYLATREVEISEAPGQRKDRTSLRFLQRGRLPRTVLAHDDRARGCDALNCERDYYSEKDFLVGETVAVFGRVMRVIGVDDTTQEWHLKKHGVDQRARAPPPTVESPSKTLQTSVAAVSLLRLKAPRKEVVKRDGYHCRWHATLAATEPSLPMPHLPQPQAGGVMRSAMSDGKVAAAAAEAADASEAAIAAADFAAQRRFRIVFYADDAAITIYESVQSGIVGGIFLKRAHCVNPATNGFFSRGDFVSGAVLTINSFRFLLGECEYEGHSSLDNAREPERSDDAAGNKA